jgi:hypothetical protein
MRTKFLADNIPTGRLISDTPIIRLIERSNRTEHVAVRSSMEMAIAIEPEQRHR